MFIQPQPEWITFIAPGVLCAVALIARNRRVLRRGFSLIGWLNVIQLFVVCAPVLERNSRVVLSEDFVLSAHNAAFIMLTALVMALIYEQSKMFFEVDEASTTDRPAISERVFYLCSAGFLAAMNCVFLSENLGYTWVSVEATTLCSAPLVYYRGSKQSIEATWKYLIICSVGIAFALIGTVLIFAAGQHAGLNTLGMQPLFAAAPSLNHELLRFGFIFCLLGYGTKAGIFPLHSWLPDAHSEAPAPASAMLSGCLLNCALFAIYRISELMNRAGLAVFSSKLLLAFGLITALAGSLFLIRQHTLKRLWAYSSIENVGLMLVAIALGSGSLFFLQAMNHSFGKACLFLLSGNVIQLTGQKRIHDIRGLVELHPALAYSLILGGLAISGTPPFGTFISEMMILSKLAGNHHWLGVVIILVSLSCAFIAITYYLGRMSFGTSTNRTGINVPVAWNVVPAALLLLLLTAGIYSAPIYLVTLR